jgi:hypothetical protein
MTMVYKAIYSDGTNFSYSEDEQGTKPYYKIDHTKLIAFELYWDGKMIHRLNLEPQQRLIYTRRTQGKLASNEKHVFYIVGFQENIRGENRQAITIIHEDGHTELISRWKNEPYGEVTMPTGTT